MVEIIIDKDACKGCGDCVDVCPSEVFEIVDGKSEAVRPEDCIECCACVEACPHGAIQHESC
ncbi:MAG: 4Fe-4S ferredoxin [Candidatus Hydrothermarchaeota archaeon]|nr:MAG: 4Fe-4S ferredoxin [Candidatus Hydrothermarchaeota archaeon]